MSNQKYSDDDILSALRKNSDLTKGEWDDLKIEPSHGTIENRFGSWNSARKEAGLELRKPSYSEEGVLDKIRKNSGLTKREWIELGLKPSVGTIINMFGGWNKAKIEAGCSEDIYMESTTYGLINEPDLSPSPQLAYILGVVEGDGSVFSRDKGRYLVQLGQTRSLFAYSFEDALSSIGLNSVTRRVVSDVSNHKDVFQTKAYSKRFVEWYESMDLNDIFDFLKTVTMKEEFLRGFFESEGENRRQESGCWRVAMYSGDKDLLGRVDNILSSLDYDFWDARGTKCWLIASTRRRQNLRFIQQVEPVIKGEIRDG